MTRDILAVIASAFLICGPSFAQADNARHEASFVIAQMLNAQSDPWQGWNLSGLQPGLDLIVETVQPKRKMKGTFVTRDADAITIQLKSGAGETISRQNVRKLTAKRRAYRWAPLIGAAVGGATVGVLATRPGMDFTRSAEATFAAIGSGIGALIGGAVRAAGKDELIYQSR